MSAIQTYTISQDFPDGEVNTSKLLYEIQSSAITVALDVIERNGDQLSIIFKAVLDPTNKNILDGNTTGPAGGLIANHDNTPSTPTDVSSDAILEAASGRVAGERTITLTGLNRNVDDTDYYLLRTGGTDFPRVQTPSPLTVVSNDANENAKSVLVEWLNENWITKRGIFQLNGTTPVQITASAMRLQSARIGSVSQPFSSNSGTLTFSLGSVNAGAILPDDGQMHRMFFTTPSNSDVRFLGYQISSFQQPALLQNAVDSACEIRLCAVSPTDSPNPPHACLFVFFQTHGNYGSNNIYVPSIPEKTDIFFVAKNLNSGSCEVAMTVTLYERVKF